MTPPQNRRQNWATSSVVHWAQFVATCSLPYKVQNNKNINIYSITYPAQIIVPDRKQKYC